MRAGIAHVISLRTLSDYSLPGDLLEQLEEMEPAERKAVLDELAVRPDLWEDADEIVSQY